MTIKILATGIELTPAIKTYVEEKIMLLERFVKKYEGTGEVEIAVEVGHTTKHHRHGEIFYAEATLSLSGDTIRVECSDLDLYAAIDRMKDILKQDIIKHKEKTESKATRARRRNK